MNWTWIPPDTDEGQVQFYVTIVQNIGTYWAKQPIDRVFHGQTPAPTPLPINTPAPTPKPVNTPGPIPARTTNPADGRTTSNAELVNQDSDPVEGSRGGLDLWQIMLIVILPLLLLIAAVIGFMWCCCMDVCWDHRYSAIKIMLTL